MKQTQKYLSFEWLNIDQLLDSPMQMLEEMNLKNFPDLTKMLLDLFKVILDERKRESMTGSEKAYLGNLVLITENLRHAASIILNVDTALIKSATESIDRLEKYSPSQHLRTQKHIEKVSKALDKENSPWNFDDYDWKAIRILGYLDSAYEKFKSQFFEEALELYSSARSLYHSLMLEFCNPEISLIALGRKIGQDEVRGSIANSGGEGKKKKSEGERNKMRPIVYAALRTLTPYQLKSRNFARSQILSDIQTAMGTKAVPGSALNDLIDEFFKIYIDKSEKEKPL